MRPPVSMERLCGIENFAGGGHGAQALARAVDWAKARPVVAAIDDGFEPQVIRVFERAAEIARQAEAENEAHVHLPRRSGDAILDTTRRLEDQRQHHSRGNLLLANAGLAIGLPGREQAHRLRVDVLARAAFRIVLVFIKAMAILLAKAPVA